MRFRPRAALARIQPYVPGKSAHDLGGAVDVVKLSSNENPLGPSPKVKEALLAEAAQAHRYPDGGSRTLRREIARRLGVEPENIIMGCGSDEVIRLLAEAYLDPGEGCAFADATFSQYAFVTRIMSAREIVVPLKEEVHDLDAFAARLAQERPRLCFICNPNNPTGTYVGRAALERFLDRVPPETLVVIDEAYIEYADAPDFPDGCELLKAGRPVVSLRTFSKIHGLAGLRVGYGVGPAEVVAALERIRPPFNVNRFAHAAALAALEDEEHVRRSREMNAAERRRVAGALAELGLWVAPSQANFLFVRLGPAAAAIAESLTEAGVLVRPTASFGRPEAIRVTVGTPEQNDRFLRALQEACERHCVKGDLATR